MDDTDESILREQLRSLVRHLGLLEKSDAESGGVTLTQCHALVEIGRRGSMNLNELAEVLGVDKSTMSRTINRLVDGGLATRALGDGDRRYVVIRLTESGRRFFEDTETGMADYYENVLARIPAQKRAQVLESLSLLNAALSAEGNG
jgi:DNA-binding MarR family transcriptional regulator